MDIANDADDLTSQRCTETEVERPSHGLRLAGPKFFYECLIYHGAQRSTCVGGIEESTAQRSEAKRTKVFPVHPSDLRGRKRRAISIAVATRRHGRRCARLREGSPRRAADRRDARCRSKPLEEQSR